MRGPQNITELLERIAAQAQRLPTEQAQAVAACLEHALRGAQEDEWYDIITHAFEEALKMYGMDKSVKDESFKFEVFEMEPEEE